jgi:hypothetical protein
MLDIKKKELIMLRKKLLLIMAILVCMVNIADAHGGGHHGGRRYYRARCGYHHNGKFRARHYGSARYDLVQKWVDSVSAELKKAGKKITPNELKKKIIENPKFQQEWQALIIQKKCPGYTFNKDSVKKNFGKRTWCRGGGHHGKGKPAEPGKKGGRHGYGKGGSHKGRRK